MATADERIKILKMVQDGRISAEQAVQLLEVLDTGTQRPSTKQPPQPPNSPPAPGAKTGRWFRVLVTDTHTGKTRVNIRIPVGLVSAGMKMGARFSPQVEGLDAAQLIHHLNSGETGKILDVYNDDQGEHIEVFID